MGESRFTSEFFAGNRHKLRELFTGTAPIVLTANGSLQMSGDQAYPFCQDASFWYFTGINEANVLLVLDKDKEYLIIPSRDERRITFEGALDEATFRQRSGIDTVLDESAGWKRLALRLEKAKHVATLPVAPAYVEHAGFYTNPARRRLVGRIKHHNSQLELLDISQHVAQLRVVKQPIEIMAMEAAIASTGTALKEVVRGLKRSTYRHEYEVEADLSRAFRRSGAMGHAFSPIVASGQRACTLHYASNDGELVANELLLCDIGASVEHYSADITRTYNVGAPSRRQLAVFDAVLEVQRFAMEQLRPGVRRKDYEKAVHGFMGEQLRELGLIKTIDLEAIAEFYPHSTSHFLGLNTHDVGDYEQPFEEGTVLTVEPGIYIRNEGIGVRIEDDVVITADGNRVLGPTIPKQLL